MAESKKSKKPAPKVKKEPPAKDDNPCWEGYEPTPGKTPGTEGSCKPKKK